MKNRLIWIRFLNQIIEINLFVSVFLLGTFSISQCFFVFLNKNVHEFTWIFDSTFVRQDTAAHIITNSADRKSTHCLTCTRHKKELTMKFLPDIGKVPLDWIEIWIDHCRFSRNHINQRSNDLIERLVND